MTGACTGEGKDWSAVVSPHFEITIYEVPTHNS